MEDEDEIKMEVVDENFGGSYYKCMCSNVCMYICAHAHTCIRMYVGMYACMHA